MASSGRRTEGSSALIAFAGKAGDEDFFVFYSHAFNIAQHVSPNLALSFLGLIAMCVSL